MSIVNDFKEIGSFLQKSGNIEIYQKHIDLQTKTLEILEKNQELRKENEELKKELEIKGKLKFKNDVYWLEGDENPFCPRCWDAEKLLMHLVTRKKYFVCPKCRYTKEGE